MRTIIVDDEQEAREALSHMLDMFCKDIEVIDTASTLDEALELIPKAKPELVFLDIDLGGRSGFELFSQLKERNFQTVFVTAHDQFAIQAIRINALDYIMKPINPDELIEATRKALSFNQQNNRDAYQSLVETHKTGKFEKIGVSTSSGVSFIELKKIVRLESEDNYTHIHLSDNRNILISKTIKSFEETLPSDQFIRCHQSHIVRIDCIRGYRRVDGGSLDVEGNILIPVSRSKRKQVQQVLGNIFPSI